MLTAIAFSAFLNGQYRDACSPPMSHASAPILMSSPANGSTINGSQVDVILESPIDGVLYPVPIANIVDVELIPATGRVVTWEPHVAGVVKSVVIRFRNLVPNTLYRLVLTEKDASVPPTCPGEHEIKSVIGEFQTAS